MARKTGKGKAKKPVARKKTAKRTAPKRKATKTTKKPRARAKAETKSAAATITTSAMDLLRSWSPSRYSTRR
ncbi:MAG TPA: hypothetical protein VKA21_07820 [Candidatus Binatia bacterium]|nr:hypothetical protein [Candidatus Binatia bacterium]